MRGGLSENEGLCLKGGEFEGMAQQFLEPNK